MNEERARVTKTEGRLGGQRKSMAVHGFKSPSFAFVLLCQLEVGHGNRLPTDVAGRLDLFRH